MLDEKSKGQEITITAPAPRHGQMIDLLEALKQSMEKVPAKQKVADVKQRKKRQA